MDITKLDSIVDADTFDFELTDPATNKPLMFLVLAGPTHPNMLAFKRRGERKLSSALKRGRDFQKAVSNTITEVLDDEDVALEREMERLLAGTIGWKGVESNGQPAPFDAKVMEDWYRKKAWLRGVVGAELTRAENFTKSSVPS